MSYENESGYDASDAEMGSAKEGEDSSTELYSGDAETGEVSENLVDGPEENLVDESDGKIENETSKEKNSEEKTQEELSENSATETAEADEADVRAEINEKSNYSEEVNEHISSVEELEVYQKANLKEEKIDGRTCLVRDDIDMDYVDPKTGYTNQMLMEKGRSPYDAETGEKIELHHIGQEYDSPLAELTESSEHKEKYSSLHTKKEESWRKDSKKSNHYNNVERSEHWKSRAKGE